MDSICRMLSAISCTWGLLGLNGYIRGTGRRFGGIIHSLTGQISHLICKDYGDCTGHRREYWRHDWVFGDISASWTHFSRVKSVSRQDTMPIQPHYQTSCWSVKYIVFLAKSLVQLVRSGELLRVGINRRKWSLWRLENRPVWISVYFLKYPR